MEQEAMQAREEFSETKQFWNILKRIYKLLATDDAQAIIHKLLEEKEVRSTVLLKEAGLTESQFHPIMRELVKCAIVEKSIGNDRGVTYSIGPFGRHVLDLSQPLLTKVRQEVKKELITS